MSDTATPIAADHGQYKAGQDSNPRALVTAGLTLETDGRRLVDGIDLRLDPATLTAIMGPNGAGKSLFLRLIHGLVAPTGGTVSWGGAALDGTIRRQQAMVFQRPVLLRRSVAANVDFVLGLRGPTDIERRDQLLDRVGLLAHARQPARLLSGGEQQRLALARALAVAPAVLFLDEPTANLDPSSEAMFETIVADVHRAGTKVILVTHNPGQARRLADDIVFLDRGRLVEYSATASFFARPTSAAATAYLAARLVI